MKNRRALHPRIFANAGFSLLEVLVTLVIVAIGLLGVAGLQVAAVKLADVSLIRTQGIQLTSEITEKIRANYSAISRDQLSSYTVAYGTAPTGTTLAAQDIAAWKTSLALLPNGDGKIDVARDTSCVTVTNFVDCQLVTITIRWSDERARGGKAASASDPAKANEFVTKTRI